jgi:hypothetical protein
MPIRLHNDYLGTKSEPFTWRDILARRQAGFSIVKTPHIGNQHPNNLLCAALGINMDMVTFTSGEKDKNFHPHVRIEAGQQRKLYGAATYTPFATVYNGESSEDYHQSAVRRVFPGTFVTTDAQLIMSESTLAEKVFRRASAVTRDLWYRKVSADG